MKYLIFLSYVLVLTSCYNPSQIQKGEAVKNIFIEIDPKWSNEIDSCIRSYIHDKKSHGLHGVYFMNYQLNDTGEAIMLSYVANEIDLIKRPSLFYFLKDSNYVFLHTGFEKYCLNSLDSSISELIPMNARKRVVPKSSDFAFYDPYCTQFIICKGQITTNHIKKCNYEQNQSLINIEYTKPTLIIDTSLLGE